MPTTLSFFRKYKRYKNGAAQKTDFQYNLANKLTKTRSSGVY